MGNVTVKNAVVVNGHIYTPGDWDMPDEDVEALQHKDRNMHQQQYSKDHDLMAMWRSHGNPVRAERATMTPEEHDKVYGAENASEPSDQQDMGTEGVSGPSSTPVFPSGPEGASEPSSGTEGDDPHLDTGTGTAEASTPPNGPRRTRHTNDQ